MLRLMRTYVGVGMAMLIAALPVRIATGEPTITILNPRASVSKVGGTTVVTLAWPKDCGGPSGACLAPCLWTAAELNVHVRITVSDAAIPNPTHHISEASYELGDYTPPPVLPGDPDCHKNLAGGTCTYLIPPVIGNFPGFPQTPPMPVLDSAASTDNPFTILCDSRLGRCMKIRAKEKENAVGGMESSEVVTEVIFALACCPCPPPEQPQKTSTSGNGETRTVQSATDHTLVLPFAVINESPVLQTLSLTLSPCQPWLILPEFGPFLTLGAGETAILYVDVMVPGGTPAGTMNAISLTAAIPGFPGSESSDTDTISVIAPATAGACCHGTVCTLASPCVGGLYLGDGTACAPMGRYGPMNACCPADFTNSGGVTVQDLFIYLAAWFAKCP